MFIVGLDIGGTNLRIGCVGEVGLIHFQKCPTAILTEGDAVANLAHFIEAWLSEHGRCQPDAISIGVPASITADRKQVFCAPNLKNAAGQGCFDGRNIVDPLEAHFHCPVFLNKDVNNLLYCDLVQMNLLNCDTVAAGYIGTGCGGALYIRGQLQYGLHSAAMDIGHISLYGLDEPCLCGKRGCVEAVGSGHVLQQIRREYFPDTPIDDLFTRYGESDVLREFVRACAQPFCMMLTLLDPDVMLIGGGVAHMRNFPFDRLCRCILEGSSNITASQSPDIRLCPDASEKGVLGAAWYAKAMIET